MPAYTIRWANRSHSVQDWQISNGDAFQLQPDWVRQAQVVVDQTYTFGVSVTTEGGFASCALTWTQGTQTWSLQSNTPNEWQLAVGGAVVTVRCFLEDVPVEEPEYSARDPVPAGA